MFEGMDFSKMGQMLDQMQAKAKQIEEENARKEFTVKSGAGMVAIRLNGAGEVLDLSIDDSLFNDKESLQITTVLLMKYCTEQTLQQIQQLLTNLKTHCR